MPLIPDYSHLLIYIAWRTSPSTTMEYASEECAGGQAVVSLVQCCQHLVHTGAAHCRCDLSAHPALGPAINDRLVTYRSPSRYNLCKGQGRFALATSYFDDGLRRRHPHLVQY